MLRRLSLAVILLMASLLVLVPTEIALGQEDVGPVYSLVEFHIENQRSLPRKVVVEYEMGGDILATKELNLRPGETGRLDFKATAWWLSFTTHSFTMKVYDRGSVLCARHFDLVNWVNVVHRIERWNVFTESYYEPCEVRYHYVGGDNAIAEIRIWQ